MVMHYRNQSMTYFPSITASAWERATETTTLTCQPALRFVLSQCEKLKKKCSYSSLGLVTLYMASYRPLEYASDK
jgi:hypothetical protein